MDILELLKKYEVSIPEDKLGDFNRDFRVAYKSAAELKKVKDDLVNAQAKIDSSVDFEGKYNTLQKKYDDDVAAKQKELDDYKFDAKVQGALSGIEFASDRVKSSVLGEIRGKGFKLNEQGTIDGLDDYLKDLYKNEPGSFKAIDAGIHTWAGGSENLESKNKPSVDDVFNRVY